jgi:hypothetical protein
MSPVCIAAGYAIMAAGLLPLLRTFAQRLPTPPRPPFDAVLAAIPAWHAGGALLEPLGPHSLVAFATVVAIAALALAALGFAARDRYPELYTISMERIDRAERMRTRRFGGFARSHDLPARVASAGPARVPGGPWVYVWSAWTSYRRTNAPAASAREALLEVGAGFVAARIIGAHLDAWIALGSTTFLMFAMVSVFSDMRLAHELRKPLFWLSGTTVFERLAALLVAGSWRLLAGIALISAGIAAGGAPPIVPLCVAGIGIPFALLLAATGFASYAILPHETDARGAMAALRILATFPAVVPALAVAGAAGFALQSAYAGVAGAAVGAILEAAIIVGLASWLLDRAAAPPLLADTGGTGRRGET